jgi:hypothetical protein
LLEKRTLQGKVGRLILESQRAKISFGERANPPQNRFRKEEKYRR